jgi:hypothetical protein
LGLAQCKKSSLPSANLLIHADQQWIVEEDLRGLRLRDTMFDFTFTRIASIPLEPDNPFKIDHHRIL